jgi:hypothetical protein
VSVYAAALNDLAQLSHTERAAQREADKTARRHMEPLEQRLARLLKSIPEEAKANGLPMTTIVSGLRGKWRGNASPGEVGAALHKLGWRRIRAWRGDGVGFRATWHPPTI